MISSDLVLLILAFGLTYLLHSSVWLLLAAGIQRIGILTSPVSINWLWKAALIGGICSTVLATLSQKEKYVFEIETNPQVSPTVAAIYSHNNTSPILQADNLEPISVPTSIKPSANPGLLPWPPMTSAYLLIGAWIMASLFFLTRQILRHNRFLQHIRNRRPVEIPEILQIFQDIKQKAGIHQTIRLTISKHLTSPVSIFLNEVCLPFYAMHSLNASQLEAMLAHELSHIKRKDALWMGFAELLHACFFFQVLHRIAIQHLHKSNELLCDALAIEHSREPLALAECLLIVAKHIRIPSRSHAMISAMAGKASDLHIRIQQIITRSNMRTSHISPYRLAFGLLSFFWLVFWAIPGFGIQEFAYVMPAFEPVNEEATLVEESSISPDSDADIEVQTSSFQVQSLDKKNTYSFSHLSAPVSPRITPNFQAPHVEIQSRARESVRGDERPIHSLPTENPDKILIDWRNDINRRHSGYRIFKNWGPKKIRELYRVNRQLNAEKRIGYDMNDRKRIVRDMDEGNSLIFTLIYPSGIQYDTLRNFMRPERDFLKIRKRSRGMKSRWRHRKRTWQKRFNDIRDWGAEGYPPINKRQMIGRLPMNNSVSISTDNNQLNFGFSPTSTYEEATISIYSKGGKLMNTFLDGIMEAGDHKFVWRVNPGTPREYVIHVQIQDQGHSYFWVYPFKLGWQN